MSTKVSATSVASTNTDRALTGADILASAIDLTPQRLDLPMLGGHIYMRPMSGDEGVAFNDLLEDPVRKKTSRQAIIAMCACTVDGKRMFSMTQVEALGKKSVPALNVMQDFAMKLNGFGKWKVPVGNDSSEAAPAASPTVSPENSEK